MEYVEANVKTVGGVRKLVTLEEILTSRINNVQEYYRVYDGRMFCPDCSKARLDLVFNPAEGRHRHLRTHAGDEHDELCPHNFRKVSETVMNSIVKDSSTFQESGIMLDNVIKMMFRKEQINVNPFVVCRETMNDRTFIRPKASSDNDKRIMRTLPRKSLTQPLDDDDFDVIKVFYGKAKISMKPSTYKNGFDIYLFAKYDINTYSIHLSDNVCKHINEFDNLKSYKGQDFIALISYFTKKVVHDKVYYNTAIRNSQLLKIVAC
jgi:hypothetical protein